jgi:amino acid adenylation domain-containing protein
MWPRSRIGADFYASEIDQACNKDAVEAMNNQNTLHHLLVLSAQRYPDRIAVEETDGSSITYRDLNQLSDQLRDRLIHLGVRRGDRVGIDLRKSIDSVASIFGILKAGAAYVPVDPGAPPARSAYIFSDCNVKIILIEKRFVENLSAELESLNHRPTLIVLDGSGSYLRSALDQASPGISPNPSYPELSVDDLAYILYTSGSTGKPKGVMLSHRNALSFVDWCSEVFEPSESDRFSSHAPFHFDLSILDIYVAIKHASTLVLVEEEIGKDPVRLAPWISDKRISIWYSTPSILSFLAQYGKLDQYGFPDLRLVLFAGEVFPIKHLRMLKDLLAKPRYFNLYGPTETNVCTYYEIPETIPADRTRPFPIGKACSHYMDKIKVVDEQGLEVESRQEGELIAGGPGVMQGYWNLPERTANAFLIDSSGERWYKTGDVVVEDENGDYLYLSRRDRMVKKRGYRVELGEIEAGLYKHPHVEEAAVIATSSEENGVQIKAFLSFKGEQNPSRIELKRFCAENLPNYMIPDFFSFMDSLPKTSTDKIDYQKLKTID